MQRPALFDQRRDFGENRRQRPDDVADSGVEFLLGVVELHRFEIDQQPGQRLNLGHIRHQGRLRIGGAPQAFANMLQALTRAVAGLQRDDRAPNHLADGARTAAGQLGDANAVVALAAEIGERRHQFAAGGTKLRPVAPFEFALPAPGGFHRRRQQLLILDAGLDRRLHGLAEIIRLAGEGDEAFPIALERGRLDLGAARDRSDHLDVLEQLLQQRARLGHVAAQLIEQRTFRRQRIGEALQAARDIAQRTGRAFNLRRRQFAREVGQGLIEPLKDAMAFAELTADLGEGSLNSRRNEFDRRNGIGNRMFQSGHNFNPLRQAAWLAARP